MHPGQDCARAERSPTGEATRDANCRRWREKVQICAPSLLKCKLPSPPAPHGLLRRSRTRTNGEAADPAPAAARGRVAPPMPWRTGLPWQTGGPDPPAAATRPPRAIAALPPCASRGPAAELPRAAAGEGRARGRWRERRGAAVTELAGRHGEEGGRARRPPWKGGREREKGAGGGERERVEDGAARLGPSAVGARGRARPSWRAAERARRGRPWGARAAEPAVGGGGGELGRGRRPACRRGETGEERGMWGEGGGR